MTKHANRKARIRGSAAVAGTSYTAALREDVGPGLRAAELVEPPVWDLGDDVLNDDLVYWRPSPGGCRVIVDNMPNSSTSIYVQLQFLRAAAAWKLPTLAIGPHPDLYGEAHPRADVYGLGPEGVGYAASSAALAALSEFAWSARQGWRVLLIDLQQPDMDDEVSGRPRVWQPSFDQVERVKDEEIQALQAIEEQLGRLSREAAPGLIVIAVGTAETVHLLPPEVYQTRISAAMHLEYQLGASFDSGLPSVDSYLPGLEELLHRVDEHRSGGAFWSGMNPKSGRLVLASLDGSTTRAVLLPDPPNPEPFWLPADRESILRAAREQRNQGVPAGSRRRKRIRRPVRTEVEMQSRSHGPERRTLRNQGDPSAS